MRECVARFSEQATAAGVTFALEMEEEIRASVDAFRLDQVVSNLLSNAIKYAPGKPVRVSLTWKDQAAVLVVEDQGAGVPEDLQNRLFERFERAASSTSTAGLGLGLFISREIVKGHGGTIELVSKPGQGARFTVRLPLSRTASV